jgi:hypothetical protein
MRLRPTPPEIPSELLTQFGEPEHVFGPNVRFRLLATLCGIILVGMGILFFVMGLGAGGARLPLADWVSARLAVPLVVLGGVVVLFTRLVPLNWVFVCPRGILRTRGDAWSSMEWTDAERFENASLTHRGVTARQCRIVRKDGTEWGFLADYISEYPRLTQVLQQRVGLIGSRGSEQTSRASDSP